MSYCRWSSNDFQCDLYIYAHGDDAVSVNVASNRPVYTEPLPPPISLRDDLTGWCARHAVVMKMVGAAERAPIGLPHDGEYWDLSYRDAAVKVRELIALGYQCDPEVADALEADAPPEAP